MVDFAIRHHSDSCMLLLMYECVWPKSSRGVRSQRTAARCASLQGRRVGFVWDFMFRGDELFPVLERELRSRYDVDAFGYVVFGNIHGGDEAKVVEALPGLLDEHGIAAVVVGNGC